MAELRPYPFALLVRRMFRELEEEDAIFHLPASRFWLGDDRRDMSVVFHGDRAATALGPAAGPQSQMAQNIVLSWLGGGRIMELKTVQIDDELDIPRPCIDMQTVGYNVEWSQELKLEQSLEEYAKGALLVRMLAESGRLDVGEGASDTVYDMSVGYDLAGIRSPRVTDFIRGMKDAGAVLERLRSEVPAEFGDLRDVDLDPRLSHTLTLSTFHGCPPDEIESIIEHLLDEEGLDCIVKLNPMLLGPPELRGLLHEELGYDEISVPDTAFERDTQWDQAVDFVGRLGDRAAERGLGFGVKFTNTLIVENHRDFFPASEKEMYLSGRPLHVLAMHLVRRFRRTFGDRYPISFSAGIERANFPDAVALGLTPVTTCSDLLKPGGYGRSRGYLDELGRRMDAASVRDVEGWIMAYEGADEQSREDAILRNTERYVETLTSDPRYQAEKNRKPPRKIGSHLELFDCITCDKCVPVCPNDANFTFPVPARTIPIVKLRREAEDWVRVVEGEIVLEQKHQIANFADFCNDCGNCDVFCPEDGGPYKIKPRFFGTVDAWRASPDLDGFAAERDGDSLRVMGRIDRREVGLQREGETLVYFGEGFRVTRSDGVDSVSPDSTAGEIDLTLLAILEVVATFVFEAPGASYAALSAARS